MYRMFNNNIIYSSQTQREISNRHCIIKYCLTLFAVDAVSLIKVARGPGRFHLFGPISLIVCSMQCMLLDRYKITWLYVCLSVCLSVSARNTYRPR